MGSTAAGTKVPVRLQSAAINKSFGKNVDQKIQQFVENKLTTLNLQNAVPTSKVAARYAEVRNGLLALANVTKTYQQAKSHCEQLTERVYKLLPKYGFKVPP